MKKGMKRWVRFILPALLAVWMLTGCGGDDQADSVIPPAKMSSEKMAVNLALTDPATGAPVAAAAIGGVVPAAAGRFTVTITGDDADKIYDGDGTRMWNTTTVPPTPVPFTNVGNFLTFYVRANPADYPLNLNVVVKGADYVTNSQSLFISAPTSSAPVVLPVNIQMTSSTLTPAERTAMNNDVGVDVKSGTVNADANGTTSPLIIATRAIPTETFSDPAGTVSTGTGSGGVELEIPSGTGLTTAAGLPVTGALTATVTYHNPVDPSSLATFPGGMAVREQPDGTPISVGGPASFVSGGFASIEIRDGSGNEVRNFDSPVTVTMTVPKNLGNPDTGLPIAAGDSVPLWSYDTDTGEWSAHRQFLPDGPIVTGVVGDVTGDGVVDPPGVDANGDWIVAFPTRHLSYFNLDWWYWSQQYRNIPPRQCDTTNFTVRGAKGKKIFFVAESVAGGFSHEAWLDPNPLMPAQESFTIYSAPMIPMRYIAYLDYVSPSNKLNSMVFNNLCSNGGSGNIFTIVDPTGMLDSKQFADVTVNVYQQCTNDLSKITPIPSNGVFAYLGASHINGLTNNQGVAVLESLEVGKTYTVEAINRSGGNPQTSPVTVGYPGHYEFGNGSNVVNFYFPKRCATVLTGGTGGTGGGTGGGL